MIKPFPSSSGADCELVKQVSNLADAAFMVPRDDRPELVVRMRRSGLTQQEIATNAGISVGTVNADLNFSSENEPPPEAEGRLTLSSRTPSRLSAGRVSFLVVGLTTVGGRAGVRPP